VPPAARRKKRQTIRRSDERRLIPRREKNVRLLALGASERAIPCSRVARAMYPLARENAGARLDWIAGTWLACQVIDFIRRYLMIAQQYASPTSPTAPSVFLLSLSLSLPLSFSAVSCSELAPFLA